MSLSDVVDRQYRLLPSDLVGRSRQVIVRGVAVEGVEFVTPLLFFEGIGRPLALDADQRMAMAHIARSTILADWIGAALVLQPVRERGQERIRLLPLEHAASVLPLAANTPVTPVDSGKRAVHVGLRILGILLVVAILLWAVSAIEGGLNLDALLDVFQP